MKKAEQKPKEQQVTVHVDVVGGEDTYGENLSLPPMTFAEAHAVLTAMNQGPADTYVFVAPEHTAERANPNDPCQVVSLVIPRKDFVAAYIQPVADEDEDEDESEIPY